MSELPPAAHLVALAALPAMGPARLESQLAGVDPSEAWRRITGGRAVAPPGRTGPSVVETWRRAALDTEVAALWVRHRAARIGVLSRWMTGYPACLVEDPDPPAVLFTRGDPLVLEGRRVGIVGTRTCTRYGVDLAYELGALLAAAGVSVVSGLAKGIDAAAHHGALDAGGAAPVAVVGSGLDVPYPRENRELWERVGNEGLLCGEAPLGSRPERWRFPARNRIIAALSEIVIVVESHAEGGSLSTAAEAVARDRVVMAVPGPIRSAASAGTNRLLADGCHPLCEPADILVALGLTAVVEPPKASVSIDGAAASVLERVGWMPATLDDIAGSDPVPPIAAALEVLVGCGLLVRRGPWYERTGVRFASTAGSNDPPEATPGGGRPRRAS